MVGRTYSRHCRASDVCHDTERVEHTVGAREDVLGVVTASG